MSDQFYDHMCLFLSTVKCVMSKLCLYFLLFNSVAAGEEEVQFQSH